MIFVIDYITIGSEDDNQGVSVKSIRYVIIKLLLQEPHTVILWTWTFTYGTRKHEFWLSLLLHRALWRFTEYYAPTNAL